MSKGSKRRPPEDFDSYGDGYDRIFNNKKKHHPKNDDLQKVYEEEAKWMAELYRSGTVTPTTNEEPNK
jgi:hypothetical protein